MRYGQWVDPLIPLDDPRALDFETVGGKAASLARLAAAGVTVVPGFVVPVSIFEGFVSGLKAEGDGMAAVILGAVLPPGLAALLRTASNKLGSRLIVRSSAIEEDGATSSWAGQFETIIGARPGREMEAALLKCWASAFGVTARAYADSRGVGRSVGMAVLIQPMLEPRCAGVMFTINPLSGSWREITVEAAWGQAAPVVQGALVPDFYVVRRPRRCPRPIQRVLAALRLEVLEDQVRHQSEKWVLGDNGLVVEPVVVGDVKAPKLLHPMLLRLCKIGLKAESEMGCPQDVEWALGDDGRFVVLQSRPITSVPPVRRSGPALWTRRFIGERWTEPATPLGWSLVGGLLEEFIGYPETQRQMLGGGEAAQLIRFAPYLNITIFRHLAFKFPGAPPPQFIMELLPDNEAKRWRVHHAQWPDFGVYRRVIRETLKARRWRLFAPGIFSNPRRWRAFESDLNDALPGLSKLAPDLKTAMARAERCKALARRYIGIHVMSLLYANLLYQLVEAALAAQGHGALVRDVLRPTEESWTVRSNQALWCLGRGQLSMEDFLAAFGHRAGSSWELFSSRWKEEPAMVEVLAEAAAQHPDPARMAKTQATRALVATAKLGPWMRRVLSLTQTYLLLREDQRFSFDRLLCAWSGQLQQIEAITGVEIRFLEADELEGLVGGSLDTAQAQKQVDGRRAAWVKECERRAAGDEPPNFLVGGEALEEEPAGLRLQGIGTSPGVVSGKVRVLRSLAEGDHLVAGEILVARATDPGWTPLFLKAGGVVMELGGMLSHGAVVAREYGLPAVVNISAATQRLKDGQWVTIDGRRGLVWVH